MSYYQWLGSHSPLLADGVFWGLVGLGALASAVGTIIIFIVIGRVLYRADRGLRGLERLDQVLGERQARREAQEEEEREELAPLPRGRRPHW